MGSVSCGMMTQTLKKKKRSTLLPSKKWWNGWVSIWLACHCWLLFTAGIQWVVYSKMNSILNLLYHPLQQCAFAMHYALKHILKLDFKWKKIKKRLCIGQQILQHFKCELSLKTLLFVCCFFSLRVQTICCYTRLWSLPASLRSCCWSHSQVGLRIWRLRALRPFLDLDFLS